MAVLDDLSGFEFEDIMEDVFRNLGYENVRQAERTADEGRDVLMEEVVDGTRRAVVVECKHTGVVGRPVVQKLHSAVATFDFDGPRRGMAVTSGRFTGSAREYVERLRNNDDPYPIELIDGDDLREIADEVGLDLYNGRIEILCDETLRPTDPAASVDTPVVEAFRDIQNIDEADLPDPTPTVTFRPTVVVSAHVDAVFETSVGVIHRVNERPTFVVHADRGCPKIARGDVAEIVQENLHATVDLELDRFASDFDEVAERRFGRTETEYKDWAVDRLRERYTTTVTYTGDNNVTYEKRCEPYLSDVRIQSIEAVYVPEIRQTTELQTYSYSYEYFAAGPSRAIVEDGIHRCVQCDESGSDETYTYCDNCGSVNCSSHTKTERLEGAPICTDCAVVERFALKKKYFYDEENLETFRKEYERMPLHEKAMENKFLAGVVAVLVVVAILAGAMSIGIF